MTIVEKNLLLDLNGKTLSETPESESSATCTVENSSLTILDSIEGGLLKNESGGFALSAANATCTLSSGQVSANGVAIGLYGASTTFSMSGGQVSSTLGNSVIRADDANVSISGGTVTGLGATVDGIFCSGALNISGGQIITKGFGAITIIAAGTLSVSGANTRIRATSESVTVQLQNSSNQTAQASFTGGVIENLGSGAAIFAQSGAPIAVTVDGASIIASERKAIWGGETTTLAFQSGLLLGECVLGPPRADYLGWAVKGNATLPENYTISRETIFTVEKDSVLTLGNGVTLLNLGVINLYGKIDVNTQGGTLNNRGTLNVHPSQGTLSVVQPDVGATLTETAVGNYIDIKCSDKRPAGRSAAALAGTVYFYVGKTGTDTPFALLGEELVAFDGAIATTTLRVPVKSTQWEPGNNVIIAHFGGTGEGSGANGLLPSTATINLTIHKAL